MVELTKSEPETTPSKLLNAPLSTSTFFSSQDILPYPKATKSNHSQPKKPQGKTCVFTSSTYKAELINKSTARTNRPANPNDNPTPGRFKEGNISKTTITSIAKIDINDSPEDCICLFCNDSYQKLRKGER